jgi:hypothetical protein
MPNVPPFSCRTARIYRPATGKRSRRSVSCNGMLGVIFVEVVS